MTEIANEARVGLANGPLVAPILGRVVGMLTARADCPIDRLDDALLVADAISAKAASFSDDGRVNVRVIARVGSVELQVGPQRYRLERGDGFTYSPREPHTWSNPSRDEPAVVLWVATPNPY